MNAYYLHKPDGTPTQVSACGNCGLVAATRLPSPGNFDISEKCCTCYECGEPLGKPRYTGSLCHEECERKRSTRLDAERMEKAQLVEDYYGPVFLDGYGYGSFGDGYFADVEELSERLDDRIEELAARPAFAYCCKPIPFRGLDVGSILENAAEDMFEGAIDHFSGEEELGAAIQAFNEANSELTSWEPDYSRKVALPAPDTQEGGAE